LIPPWARIAQYQPAFRGSETFTVILISSAGIAPMAAVLSLGLFAGLAASATAAATNKGTIFSIATKQGACVPEECPLNGRRCG
jgi:hypothetical protein